MDAPSRSTKPVPVKNARPVAAADSAEEAVAVAVAASAVADVAITNRFDPEGQLPLNSSWPRAGQTARAFLFGYNPL